ncbi:MAG: hypothetical protein ACE5K1_01815 [Acidiferrobacterales bacterium]
MLESGWILYVLLVALLYLFWRHMHGLSFQDMLDRSATEHHTVLKVIEKHPHGGSWPKHKRWMAAAQYRPHTRSSGKRIRRK